MSPTLEEVARAEQRCGLRVPGHDELAEIEATSRLRIEHGALYLSAPLIAAAGDDSMTYAPTGFVLSERFLLTVRFDPVKAFDAVHEQLDAGSPVSAAEVFTRLVEELVDRSADRLERAAQAINDASHEIFADSARHSRLSRDTRRMRGLIVAVGRASERISRVRYTFLSIGRMAGFVGDRGAAWLDAGLKERLEAVRHDIASLDEFEDSLSNRVQLLQDAAANFVSLAQNDVVKLLTIVSVVGVPPVLVVGVYGMNFRFMPELQWHYGYPFALALMVASAVVPLIWFRFRGWL